MADELEHRSPVEVVRPNIAAMENDDDRYNTRELYLKKFKNNLNILAQIEKEKPKLCALTETNISERSETEFK